jgi:hypothetical protein
VPRSEGAAPVNDPEQDDDDGDNQENNDKARHPHLAASGSLRFADLVTDDAANRRAGGCSENPAADDVTRNAAYDGAGGGASVLRGHSGTTAQTD